MKVRALDFNHRGFVVNNATRFEGVLQGVFQIAPGKRLGILHDFFHGSLCHHLTTPHPGAGAHVDNMLGFFNGVFVVFNHH